MAVHSASVCERVRSPRYRWDSRGRGQLPQVILQRTISGVGSFQLGKVRHAVPAGSCFIALPPERSEYRFDPALADHWEFGWLNLRGELAFLLWHALRKRFGTVFPLPDGTAPARAFSELTERMTDPSLPDRRITSERLYALHLSCWDYLEGRGSGIPTAVAQLRERIRTEYRRPVNIKTLCGEVGQSREHLSRAFHQAYGTHPAADLRTRRIEAAETLLLQSSLPIAEIARQTGFATARQFTKTFTVATGLPPTLYRSQARATA